MRKPANDDFKADDLLTAAEFAAEFQGKLFNSRGGLYRFMHIESSPFFKIGGRWYVRRSELDTWLRARRAA